MHLDDRFPDLDFLIRPEPHAVPDLPAIQEDPVPASEILDQELIEIDRELGVPRGNPVALDEEVRVFPGSDHVVAGWDGAPDDFDAAQRNHDLDLGHPHKSERFVVIQCYNARLIRQLSEWQGNGAGERR
jgi:hypothetical protein